PAGKRRGALAARGATWLLRRSSAPHYHASLPSRRYLFRPPRVAPDPTSDLCPSVGPGAARRHHLRHAVTTPDEGPTTPWAVQCLDYRWLGQRSSPAI